MNKVINPIEGDTSTLIGRAALVGMFLLLTLAGGAHAQEADDQRCFPYDQINDGLKNGYGETQWTFGVSEETEFTDQYGQTAFVMYGNVETGTWTLVEIYSDGIACMRVGGTDFHVIIQGEDT